MRILPSIAGGLAGALTVTLIHEILKRTEPDAPRMDKLGMEAIAKGMEAIDEPVPTKKDLFGMAFAGEIISNTAYYSLTGLGKRKNATSKGNILGIAAGLGAIFLPKPMGLSERQTNRTFKTQMLSLGLYMLGGFVASQVTQ
ncbi:MAG: hypothetical protein EOP49_12100, partial [Sphingobacteriales bacterium]